MYRDELLFLDSPMSAGRRALLMAGAAFFMLAANPHAQAAALAPTIIKFISPLIDIPQVQAASGMSFSVSNVPPGMVPPALVNPGTLINLPAATLNFTVSFGYKIPQLPSSGAVFPVVANIDALEQSTFSVLIIPPGPPYGSTANPNGTIQIRVSNGVVGATRQEASFNYVNRAIADNLPHIVSFSLQFNRADGTWTPKAMQDNIDISGSNFQFWQGNLKNGPITAFGIPLTISAAVPQAPYSWSIGQLTQSIENNFAPLSTNPQSVTFQGTLGRIFFQPNWNPILLVPDIHSAFQLQNLNAASWTQDPIRGLVGAGMLSGGNPAPPIAIEGSSDLGTATNQAIQPDPQGSGLPVNTQFVPPQDVAPQAVDSVRIIDDPVLVWQALNQPSPP
jgi:hypothetical protein